jgi:hypothetical protein
MFLHLAFPEVSQHNCLLTMGIFFQVMTLPHYLKREKLDNVRKIIIAIECILYTSVFNSPQYIHNGSFYLYLSILSTYCIVHFCCRIRLEITRDNLIVHLAVPFYLCKFICVQYQFLEIIKSKEDNFAHDILKWGIYEIAIIVCCTHLNIML